MFEYPNLRLGEKQIRLLTFQGEGADGKLEFLLETTNLHERPFIALSYTWSRSTFAENDGETDLLQRQFHLVDDVRSVEISVNGSRFLITPNLHSFLQAILDGNILSGVFYIDQICINQEDIREQGHQVALMGQIYSTAIEVIAWLQPMLMPSLESLRWLKASKNTQRLRNMVRDLNDSTSEDLMDRSKRREIFTNQAIESPGESVKDLKGLDSQPEELGSRILEPTEAELPLLNDLVKIFFSACWSRQWIVQEVLLAPKLTLQVGSFAYDWQILLDVAAFWFSPTRNTEDLGTSTLWALVDGFRNTNNLRFIVISCIELLSYRYEMLQGAKIVESRSISRILIKLGNRDCKHWRDRFFSLFSLTDSKLEPDYKKPLVVLFIEILATGLADIKVTADRLVAKFIQAAILASGLPLSNTAVQLILWQTVKIFDVRENDVIKAIRGIRMIRVNDLHAIPQSTEGKSFNILQNRGSQEDGLSRATRMRLRHSRITDASLELPDEDHQTGRWSTIRKSYSEWVQLVNDVVAGTVSRISGPASDTSRDMDAQLD